MSDEQTDSLSDVLAEVELLELAAASGEWLTLPDFLASRPWEWVDDGRGPPPDDEAGLEAAIANLKRIFDAWERVLKSPALKLVKTGVSHDVLARLIFNSLHDAASWGRFAVMVGEKSPETFADAVAEVRRWLQVGVSDMRPHVAMLKAAIQVNEKAGKPSLRRKSGKTKGRAEFVANLLKRGLGYKEVSQQWKTQTGQDVSEVALKQEQWRIRNGKSGNW